METSLHLVAQTLSPPNVVQYATSGRFRSDSSVDLVISRETALELVQLLPSGELKSLCLQHVLGAVLQLCSLPWAPSVPAHCQSSGSSPANDSSSRECDLLLASSGALVVTTIRVALLTFLSL
jgi:hypothetical protein